MSWAAGALWHRGARRGFTKWLEPDLYDERKRTLDSLLRQAATSLRHRKPSVPSTLTQSGGVRPSRSSGACVRRYACLRVGAAVVVGTPGQHMRRINDGCAKCSPLAVGSRRGRSMRTWIACHQAAERQHELMSWAAGALWHRGARRGFTKWLEPDLYDARKQTRNTILRQAAVSLRQRNLHRCINSWETWWRKRVALQRAVVRVIENWRGLRHRRGWNSWRYNAAKHKRLRGMWAACRWYREARAMRTWIAYGNASQWWREALIWAIGAMRHRRCRTAFTAWSGPYKYDDRERYLRSLVRRSAFALRQRDTFRAASKWSFWYRSLQETKLQRKAVKKQKEHETEVIVEL